MSTASNKEIVNKLNALFAEGDVETFIDYCADNVVWGMVGSPALEGKEAVSKAMKTDDFPDPPKIMVKNVIADGDMVMSDGTMSMKKKDGTIVDMAYCDVYKFANGQIIELTSYIIDLKK
ncbi:nuclear transport factor 2 family protein [Solitalea sp. MAHUQ-68]|uniref:Nuclear transport factor 2 family protein n=1 Tax=Solitalea agri TaxID=2953739 RepID=A0A9X2F2C8_9SPHI|nr:nuclear transport factor 2 family protein [Solitalea agri]MCO4293322.1 nuclear transport factor 2 family protein [Solitalea agri]